MKFLDIILTGMAIVVVGSMAAIIVMAFVQTFVEVLD